MADVEKLNVNGLYEIADPTARATATAAQTEVEGIRTGADGVVYQSAGEAIREQLSALANVTRANLQERTAYVAPYSQGRIGELDGANVASTTRVRTNTFKFPYSMPVYCNIATGYKFAVFEYDGSGVYIGFTWYTSGPAWVPVSADHGYRFLVALISNEAIAPNDLSDDVFTVTYYDTPEDIIISNSIINGAPWLPIKTYTAGFGYISSADGEVKVSTNNVLSHTEYIDISRYKVLYYRRLVQSTSLSLISGMAFYDEDYSYISGEGHEAGSAGTMSANIRRVIAPDGAKYARFSRYTTRGSGVDRAFRLYGVPLALYNAEKGAQTITTRRNSRRNVEEAVSIAESYKDKGLTYGFDTILTVDQETNEIDCSTFVGLILRGYRYDETSYYTEQWASPDAWVANPEVSWSINPFNYAAPKTWNAPEAPEQELGKIRTAAQLAEWLISRGCLVPKDDHLANLEPGDILFYARTNSSDNNYVDPDRFLNINHCALCISKEAAPSDDPDWNTEKYPFKHRLIDSRTRSGSIGYEVVEDGQNDPTLIYGNNVNTLVLICRPDLGAI